ncbi:Uma2 family endonuclease [Frankia sp. AgB1.9]|uniref:Uma2 family endonuclease n=1 Tax=unclassified Frankia TaxID=2632575 RepID=UPI001932450C|nr:MULTISPECIES: Uma2 family endonuclease [unclassified Frankia]MBL7492342.1 Uma2 family endonuclease [Frankia sp. AgW1.1]MBL7547003.1 Uma2 family endonuclease [Frankia sp. AgB1.9]MBL7622292.1 Uma2 family endonuclease [Frankia sp. AgB1.8]
MALPAPPVTVAALDAIDADDGRVELLDGLCVLRPWPTPLRTRVTQRLAELLTAAAPSGAHVFPHGLRVEISARTLVIPDLVVGPVPTPAGPPTDADPSATPPPATTAPARITEPPFLVIEVADEHTRRYNRTLKLDLYRDRGIPSCWLVDPDPAGRSVTIEIYDLVDGGYVRAGRAIDDTPLSVTRPFPVRFIPADLVDPGD